MGDGIWHKQENRIESKVSWEFYIQCQELLVNGDSIVLTVEVGWKLDDDNDEAERIVDRSADSSIRRAGVFLTCTRKGAVEVNGFRGLSVQQIDDKC